MVRVDWLSQSKRFRPTKSAWEIKERKTKWRVCRLVSGGILLFCTYWRFFHRQVFNQSNERRRFDHGTANNSKWASPVYGMYRLMSNPTGDKPVEIVTAINPPHVARGIVLLLHACTHNALKFFSPGPECPNCVGLSEELFITRLVLQRGYIPIAATTADTKSGCWSNIDIPRLKLVIQTIQSEFKGPETHQNLPVIAIGASSGGYMGAKIAAEGLVDAALVMVMGLQPGLQKQLLQLQPPLYLAPMPRDKATCNRNRENYRALLAAGYSSSPTTGLSKQVDANRTRIILDETSCVSLPVTENYLTERVPGMREEDATKIIQALQKGRELSNEDSMFIRDPTVSDWRNVLLAIDPNSSSEFVLWGRYPLAPGQSPLAKAFHRAWAFMNTVRRL